MTRAVSHKPGVKKKAPKDIVSSRAEAVQKMLAAAERHLGDYTEAEREAWAERTVDEYLCRGIIAIAEVSA